MTKFYGIVLWYKQSNERLNESKDTKSARTFKKKCFDFFYFFVLFWGWFIGEGEREREEEERETLGYGLENVNLGDFSFYSLFVDVAISVSTDRLSRDLSEWWFWICLANLRQVRTTLTLPCKSSARALLVFPRLLLVYFLLS